MSHSVTITGVPKPANPGPADINFPRLDIRDLVKNKKQFCIYVQAVDAMQKTPENIVKSWFEVCGIHGLPYRSWDKATNPSNTTGYCEHGTLLFPTWHRPYVGLYEQILHEHAVAIASKYTTADKHLYQDAANTLRVPYWDWASEAIPPKEVIEYSHLQIILSNGVETSFPNPLLSYAFNPGFDQGTQLPSVARDRPQTVRCAKPGGKVTDLPSLIASLQGNGMYPKTDWRDETYDLLTRAGSWSLMSNGTSKHSSTEQNRDAVNSLEAIHGNVHVVTGGDGHMSSVPVAGFDPIFWMHHCQVDRVLALWQAIHYDQFMDADLAVKDLLPFWNKPTTSTFWNSNEARTTQVLNYLYPEFANLDLNDKPAVKAAIMDKINKLYGPTNDEVEAMASLAAAAPPQQQAQQPIQQAGGGAAGQGSFGKGHIPHARRDWTVRVRSKLHEFGSSYTVLIFVGEPPAQEHEWRTAPTYVGSFAAFVNSSPEHCSNCQKHAESIVEGFVPLNTHFIHRRAVPSTHPDYVVPYLKNQIHWRIQKTDGAVVAPNEVKHLEVAVMSVPLEYSAKDKCLKMSSRPTHHAEITNGKAGGRSL